MKIVITIGLLLLVLLSGCKNYNITTTVNSSFECQVQCRELGRFHCIEGTIDYKEKSVNEVTESRICSCSFFNCYREVKKN